MQKYIEETTYTKYIVIAGVSSDYTYLETQSQKISKKTEIVFDNQGMEYDKKRGIIVPDSSSDEIYAGGYFPRRYDNKRISIEMLWYYKDSVVWDSSKEMIIITGIFDEKKDAEAQLNIVKSVVPTAYIKKKSMYMGCMHQPEIATSREGAGLAMTATISILRKFAKSASKNLPK